MIISNNSKPPLEEFRELMKNLDIALNEMARKDEDYFKNRGGKKLEQDVFNVLKECAVGTNFENTIVLVSGSSFPDIVANKYYGVEVKSTEKNHWTSIGSSILESTRIEEVERIFLTFGKLGHPVEFLSRPYEECLSDIAVTHYPRYKIDMRLKSGETIFDKIGIPYDELRAMDNPVEPVSKYYTSQLKEGEKLWWASESEAPPTIRLWSNLSHEEKEELIIAGLALFPEIVMGDYNKYTMWLVTEKSIINPNVRDGFSAGGKIDFTTADGKTIKLPAVFGRIEKYSQEIKQYIETANKDLVEETWKKSPILEGIKRYRQWRDMVSSEFDYMIEGNPINDIIDTYFIK